MDGIRHIAVAAGFGLVLLSAAAGQTETGLFAFGDSTYPADVLDQPREQAKARCPELFRPPAVGDALAYRVFRGPELQREISAAVVATNRLDCADGPEISIHPGQLRFDLLRALYLTDALHQTPQTGSKERPPLPPPQYVPKIAPAHSR